MQKKQPKPEIDYCAELKLAVREDRLVMRPVRALGGFGVGMLAMFAIFGLVMLALAAMHSHAEEIFHVSSERDADNWLSLVGIIGGVVSVFLGFKIADLASELLRWKLVLDKASNQALLNDKPVCRLTDIKCVCSGMRPEPGTTTVALIQTSGREIPFFRGFMSNPTYGLVVDTVANFLHVPQRNVRHELLERAAEARERLRNSGK
jgi:hypothetical protein